MGMVVNVPESAMDSIIYGNKNNMISNYISNQMQQLPQQFNEFSSRIYNTMSNTYEFINDKLIQYGILNQLEQQNLVVIDNKIEELTSFEQLNNANITMQRYVMANPTIREHYNQQNVDGYSDTYNNLFEKDIGDKHYDYRRVMDEVLIDNDKEYTWKVHSYTEDLQVGDRELDHREKCKIINTWEAMDHFLDVCKFDFTNVSEEPTKINFE